MSMLLQHQHREGFCWQACYSSHHLTRLDFGRNDMIMIALLFHAMQVGIVLCGLQENGFSKCNVQLTPHYDCLLVGAYI